VYDTPYGTLRYYPDADALHGQLAGVRLRCDAAEGIARIAATAFAGRALYLATHPLATISLMELLERRGLYSLHAACLAAPSGDGVLIAGPSGAGKSTLALALARAGMGFLSDDVVFLSPVADAADGGVRALGFADAVGLSRHAAERFGELAAAAQAPPVDGFPKRLGRVEQLLDVRTVAACRPAALVFPQVAREQPSAIAPLDPGEALLRLVPDVLLTDPATTHAHVGAIAALLEQVRCYALQSGSDLERAAALVRELV